MNREYYDLLGLNEDATDEEIKERYGELKKKYKGIVYKRRITPPEDAAGEFIAGRAPLCEHPPQSSQQPQRKTAAAAVCRKSLAEFAPAGANKVQSIFASRLANVRA